MIGKYVKFKKGLVRDYDSIIMFENEVRHDEMVSILKLKYPNLSVSSAGFWDTTGFESKVKVDTWANIVSKVDYLSIDGLTIGALRISYDFIKYCISKKEIDIVVGPQGRWLTYIDGKTYLVPIDIIATKQSYLRAEDSLELYSEIINKKVDLSKLDTLTELYYIIMFEPAMWSFIKKHHR